MRGPHRADGRPSHQKGLRYHLPFSVLNRDFPCGHPQRGHRDTRPLGMQAAYVWQAACARRRYDVPKPIRQLSNSHTVIGGSVGAVSSSGPLSRFEISRSACSGTSRSTLHRTALAFLDQDHRGRGGDQSQCDPRESRPHLVLSSRRSGRAVMPLAGFRLSIGPVGSSLGV